VSGTYAYNGDGLRTSRTIASTTVDYVWDLNAALPVVLGDSDGNRYVYGLDLLTRVNGTDEEWYLYDGLGSTTGLADGAGDVTGSYAYDAFGTVRSQSGAATEWSYTGEQVDPSGLQYLRARYYDAQNGRFLNEDPSGTGHPSRVPVRGVSNGSTG
jgi:RHS repeat-associated protein